MAYSVKELHRVIVNGTDSEFPRRWSINTLDRHKEIYYLLKEYDELAETYADATPAAKKLIEPRLKEIENTLVMNYYIVTKDELIAKEKYDE